MVWKWMRCFVESIPQIMPVTLSMPLSMASHSTFLNLTAKIDPATSAHHLAFPHTGHEEHSLDWKSLQTKVIYLWLWQDKVLDWKERLQDGRLHLRILLCNFAAQALTEIAMEWQLCGDGEGVMWKVDTSWTVLTCMLRVQIIVATPL